MLRDKLRSKVVSPRFRHVYVVYVECLLTRSWIWAVSYECFILLCNNIFSLYRKILERTKLRDTGILKGNQWQGWKWAPWSLSTERGHYTRPEWSWVPLGQAPIQQLPHQTVWTNWWASHRHQDVSLLDFVTKIKALQASNLPQGKWLKPEEHLLVETWPTSPSSVKEPSFPVGSPPSPILATLLERYK